MKYDVLIIGAGPGGLFCAHELLKVKDISVAIVDIGKSYNMKSCPLKDSKKCAHCKICSTLTGGGGSAFFHSGKLSFYPAGSGLKKLLDNESDCLDIYDRVKRIFNTYGISLENEDEIANNLFEQYESDGIKIKYYQSNLVSEYHFKRFIDYYLAEISDKATMYFETEIVSLTHDAMWSIIAKGKNQDIVFEADNVVIAVGEYGFQWWYELSNKLGVDKSAANVDIGVRIECPSELLSNIWLFHKDIKAKVKAPDGSEVRTYCVLKNGQSIYCNHKNFTVLDGISDSNSSIAGITIFNRITPTVINSDETLPYAIDYLNAFYKYHKEPVYTNMGAFLGGNTSLIDFKQVMPSLLSLEYTNNIFLPNLIRRNIVYGIHSFERIIPGLANHSNAVLMPVVDNFWDKISVSKYMESSIDGLYVVGDATGIMRGIMQACVSGVLCADGISQKYKEV